MAKVPNAVETLPKI